MFTSESTGSHPGSELDPHRRHDLSDGALGPDAIDDRWHQVAFTSRDISETAD
jgi:hypothetical protein